MKNIKTINDLENKLSKELAWRKKEIIDLNLQCEEYPKNTIIHKSAILLIYAHWEGFIKNAAVHYLEFLNNQDIICKNMHDNFTALHLGKSIKGELNSKIFKHRKLFISTFVEENNKKFSVIAKESIQTNSNLDSKQFSMVLEQIGLSKDGFDLKFKLLDHQLMCYRNAIAHGEFRSDKNIFNVTNQIKDAFLEMLILFHDRIITSAENKEYLKSKLMG